MYGCRMAGYHRCMGVVWLDIIDVWHRCMGVDGCRMGYRCMGVVWLDHRCMGVVWLDIIDVWVSYGWTS